MIHPSPRSQDPDRSTRIGRARTVLVFAAGQAARATVSSIVARVRRPFGRRRRLVFRGPAGFAPEAAAHLRDTVLAVVDQITESLGISRKCFEVSAVNVGAASSSNIGLAISGFSADAAVLLAMLSAALRLPIPQNVVVTGHIASAGGDLGPVANLPAKLAAAAASPDISRLLHPLVDPDGSLAALAPDRRDEINDAVSAVKGDIQMVSISDVSQLLQEICTDRALVEAALRRDFFEEVGEHNRSGSVVDRAAAFLARGNEERFWRVLETHLFAGRDHETKDLLRFRLGYQLRRTQYPPRFGGRLLRLVWSLPPATRRTRKKTLFPLMTMADCLKLAHFATPEDMSDTQHLFDAASGRDCPSTRRRAGGTSSEDHRDRDAEAAIDAALTEISAETLAVKIGSDIDAARAAFVMQDVTTDSYEAYLDTVTAFYLAVLRRTGQEPDPGAMEAIAADAMALVERAFRDRGGAKAARAEARDGTNGGLRLVLDAMTEQLKTERQFEHVDRVMKEILDPLDWEARVAFMGAFLDRLGPQLPPELRSQPPERFAQHYDTILRTYVQSVDRVKQVLRNL